MKPLEDILFMLALVACFLLAFAYDEQRNRKVEYHYYEMGPGVHLRGPEPVEVAGR